MTRGAEIAAVHVAEGRLVRLTAEIIGLCEAARRAHYAQRTEALPVLLNAIIYVARALASADDRLGRTATEMIDLVCMARTTQQIYGVLEGLNAIEYAARAIASGTKAVETGAAAG